MVSSQSKTLVNPRPRVAAGRKIFIGEFDPLDRYVLGRSCRNETFGVRKIQKESVVLPERLKK